MKGLSKFIKWFIFSVCIIILGLFFMSLFPGYAFYILTFTILIVAIVGALIGVFLIGPGFYIDEKQIKRDLLEAKRFKIEPEKRTPPIILGFVLLGFSFMGVKFFGNMWLSTNFLTWGILTIIIMVVGMGLGAAFLVAGIFPHFLIKEPQTIFKRFIRKLIKI